MKLYYSKGACSLSPHIVLQELGLKYELEPVNLSTKHMRGGGDYWQINAKGSVPAIQLDNGEILTEGPVIVQYLADQKPESGMMPKAGTWERYRAQEWLNYITSEVHKGFTPLFNPKLPDDAKNHTWEALSKKFTFLSDHLGGDYLMGSHFSAPDAYLYTVLSWASALKRDLKPWPKLEAYVKRVSERPAVQAAHQAEQGR